MGSININKAEIVILAKIKHLCKLYITPSAVDKEIYIAKIVARSQISIKYISLSNCLHSNVT